MLRRLLLLFAAAVLVSAATAACAGGPTASTSSSAEADPVVVARVADAPITLEDFERRYARSVGGRDSAMSDSLSAYRDFLDRYVDFRAKVKAARDAGLDTLESVRRDVRNYREQIARPRLVREEIMRPIVRTLYERRQTEVNVSHILLRVGPNASAPDTLNAYRKMQNIRDSLEQGASFASMALRYSEDPSAQQEGRRGYEGRLGYVTAGDLVEPFEDEMYATPEDSVSDIFRTRFGYHLLKVHDRRPRPQPRQISHILIRTGPRSGRDSTEARRLADSLQQAAAGGSDFAELARNHSDDTRSAQKGGDLGMLEPSSRLPEAFRSAMLALDSTGAVSDVVPTRFGYHILKLTDIQERRSFEESYDDLRQQASRMPRVEQRQNRLADVLRDEIGARVDTTVVLATIGTATLDSTAAALLNGRGAGRADSSFARIGDSTYAVRDLRRYVASVPGAEQMPVRRAIRDFIDEKTVDYATARLVQQDDEFAATLREYREGVLLFRYMQDSVWTAASRDTAGLRALHRSNPERYRFPDRVRTLVLRSAADSLLHPYVDAHADSMDLTRLASRARSDSLVELDTVMVTDSSSAPYRQMLSVPDGAAAGPLADGRDRAFLIRDRLLPARPKRFAEARSEVVRDYQNRYEERVVERLRRRYDVRTYPERLDAAFSGRPSAPESGASMQ